MALEKGLLCSLCCLLGSAATRQEVLRNQEFSSAEGIPIMWKLTLLHAWNPKSPSRETSSLHPPCSSCVVCKEPPARAPQESREHQEQGAKHTDGWDNPVQLWFGAFLVEEGQAVSQGWLQCPCPMGRAPGARLAPTDHGHVSTNSSPFPWGGCCQG